MPNDVLASCRNAVLFVHKMMRATYPELEPTSPAVLLVRLVNDRWIEGFFPMLGVCAPGHTPPTSTVLPSLSEKKNSTRKCAGGYSRVLTLNRPQFICNFFCRVNICGVNSKLSQGTSASLYSWCWAREEITRMEHYFQYLWSESNCCAQNLLLRLISGSS